MHVAQTPSYKLITNDVTLSGGPNDVWIFQLAGRLNQGNAARMTAVTLQMNAITQPAP